MVRLLLAKGAKVNAKGKDGVTPLRNAASYGCTEAAAGTRKYAKTQSLLPADVLPRLLFIRRGLKAD